MSAVPAIARAPSASATGALLGALVAPAALGASTSAIALPAISDDLGLTGGQAVWVLAGYMLAAALAVPVLGRLGDLRGIRSVLLAGAASAVGGSLIVALAGSFPMLLGGRLLQGAAFGALPIAAFAIVAAHYEGADRAVALGALTAVLSAISGSGTLIGGVLTDATDWRVVVALPALVLLALPAALRLAPSERRAGARLDVAGAALVAAFASAAILLLETPSVDFAGWMVAALAIVALGTAVAIAGRIRRRPDGFVPAAVVASPRFVLGTLAAMTLFAAYLAMLFAAPLLLLREHDWTTTTIGLVLLPAAALGAVGARVAARLNASHDPFHVAAALAAGSAAGLLVGGLGAGAPLATVAAFGLVLGGFAASQGGLVAQVPLAVEPGVRSVATGLFQLASLLGGAMGSAAVVGLSEPLGLAGAVAAVAAVPAAGALLALAAGRAASAPAPSAG
jgi:MFS family permease